MAKIHQHLGMPVLSIDRDSPHWPGKLNRLVELTPATLTGLGDWAILRQSPVTAFFSSNRSPSHAVIAALDWAHAAVKTRRIVISGFHSPLEQSVLKILLHGDQSVIWVMARNLEQARLPLTIRQRIGAGRLLVISAINHTQRLTAETAYRRNMIAAMLADEVMVAHARPGGATARLMDAMRIFNDPVTLLTRSQI